MPFYATKKRKIVTKNPVSQQQQQSEKNTEYDKAITYLKINRCLQATLLYGYEKKVFDFFTNLILRTETVVPKSIHDSLDFISNWKILLLLEFCLLDRQMKKM